MPRERARHPAGMRSAALTAHGPFLPGTFATPLARLLEGRRQRALAIARRPQTVQLARLVGDHAAKYTDPGGSLHLAAERIEGEAILGAIDSGFGIAPEMLDPIFRPFKQPCVTSTANES
jgi:hypothetical protein